MKNVCYNCYRAGCNNKNFFQNDIHTEFDQKNLHVLLFIFNSHVNRY